LVFTVFDISRKRAEQVLGSFSDPAKKMSHAENTSPVQDEVLNKLCRLTPAAWLKLRRTSRLFMWRPARRRYDFARPTRVESA
jgi:hypothetical protein